MTEREKIMNLAKECGLAGFLVNDYSRVMHESLEAFYHAAQKEAFEQAAKVCEKKWRKEDSFDSHANAQAIRQLIKE